MDSICRVVTPLSLALLAGAAFGQSSTERISARTGASASSAAAVANGNSGPGYTTPDGRWSVFSSAASDLVLGDTNGVTDVFVRDRLHKNTVRVSVPTPALGGQSNGASTPSGGGSRVMSDDGRFIIFESDAGNLVAGDTNTVTDIFVHDRDFDGNGLFDEGLSGTRTTRVNLTTAGTQGNGACPNNTCNHYSNDGVISADGRYVAWVSPFDFSSESASYSNIYWRDRDTDNDGVLDESNAVLTRLVSGRTNPAFNGVAGDGASSSPAISADGLHVAFLSLSRFLVLNDLVANNEIFARGMNPGGVMKRMTTPLAGGQPDGGSGSPTISADGSVVAFATNADNLASGVETSVQNIVVLDRDTDNDGVLDETGAVSFEGASRFPLPFFLPGQDPMQPLNGSSFSPTLSDDGRYVSFSSAGDNFSICVGVIGQPTTADCTDTTASVDVFVYDSSADRLARASIGRTGLEPNADCVSPTLSANGRWATFTSSAGNVEPNDSGTFNDAFVHAMFAPENDSCGTAVSLSTGASAIGDNMAAAQDGGEPCALLPGRSVWYRLTAQTNGSLTADTQYSPFDTTLVVYAGGCPQQGGQIVACNDDAFFLESPLASSVTFTTSIGTTYYIRVGGYIEANGLFRLNVGSVVPACPSDWDADDDSDSDDILAFFSDWENGSGDFDGDDDSDSDDILGFFGAWESGC